MERVICFALLLAALAWAYYRGRYVEKVESWSRMREVAQELTEVTQRCIAQAETGEETECEKLWMDGAVWVLKRWKEGIWQDGEQQKERVRVFRETPETHDGSGDR